VRGRNVAVDVEEGDTELDDFEEVDVAADCLVVVRGFGVEVADWARDDTGEFCILGVE
jgi:hypothetical protein